MVIKLKSTLPSTDLKGKDDLFSQRRRSYSFRPIYLFNIETKLGSLWTLMSRLFIRPEVTPFVRRFPLSVEYLTVLTSSRIFFFTIDGMFVLFL